MESKQKRLKAPHEGFLRKRQGAVLAKKGQFASYKEKLEKLPEFHSL
jgi:hypothetical protein